MLKFLLPMLAVVIDDGNWKALVPLLVNERRRNANTKLRFPCADFLLRTPISPSIMEHRCSSYSFARQATLVSRPNSTNKDAPLDHW